MNFLLKVKKTDMITVKNLTKYFQQTAAVDDVSFEVKKGDTLVLLGTSGSGKTTTLRMINRLVEPSSGAIFIEGQNTLEMQPELLRRSIGYVLQNNGLFPHYTVAENIGIVPQLLGWTKQAIHDRAAELLSKLHLEPDKYLHRYPRELSGGQQQRVGLARALASDPPILLMDEPFGALDPITRASIRKEFLELDELKRKTIIMVTHDIEEAFELGNRICLMDGGKIQQIGTPYDLLFNPSGDFAHNIFGNDHLLLEMKTVKIRDIWNYLESASESETENSGRAEVNESLWKVMQNLTTKRAQTLVVTIKNESKAITLQGIFNSLKQLKAN